MNTGSGLTHDTYLLLRTYAAFLELEDWRCMQPMIPMIPHQAQPQSAIVPTMLIAHFDWPVTFHYTQLQR